MLLAIVLAGCSGPVVGIDGGERESDAGVESATGRECLPESVPAGGFDSREVYLETNSAVCGAGEDPGTCVVYQLDGDPRTTDCAGCPTSDEVRARVFCSCRCSSDVEGAELCACPTGFACVDDVVTSGPDSARGGYCIRDGL